MEAFDSSSKLLRSVAGLISSLENYVDEEKEEVVDRYQKILNTTHSQMLGKFEYTGGPIFKVVLEC